MYSVWFYYGGTAQYCFISGLESYSLAVRIADNLMKEEFVRHAFVVED